MNTLFTDDEDMWKPLLITNTNLDKNLSQLKNVTFPNIFSEYAVFNYFIVFFCKKCIAVSFSSILFEFLVNPNFLATNCIRKS